MDCLLGSPNVWAAVKLCRLDGCCTSKHKCRSRSIERLHYSRVESCQDPVERMTENPPHHAILHLFNSHSIGSLPACLRIDLDNLQVHINALTTCLHHISGNHSKTSIAHEEICQGRIYHMSFSYLHVGTGARHA